MADSNSASKGTTGRPRNPYITDAMALDMEKRYVKYDAIIQQRPLMTADDHAFTLNFKKGEAADFVEVFANAVNALVPELTVVAWTNRVLMLFKNRFTNKHSAWVKRNRLEAAARANASNSPSLGPPLSREEDKRIGKLMRSTWLALLQEESPRTIFLDENEALVQEKISQIAQEPGNKAFGGGLQKAAEARAWDECADKEKYEELAKNPPGRETARQYFSPLMQKAMQDIVKRKVLGDVVMKTSVGWRQEDGSVHVETFTVAYDASMDQELQFVIDDLATEQETFICQADQVLPNLYPALKFPLNDEGVPLWPAAETRKMSPDQVDDLIRRFLGALWAYAHGLRRPIPLVPYAEMNESPQLYYDTNLFKLPTTLSLENSNPHQLAHYFEKVSPPFQFFSRESVPVPVPSPRPAPGHNMPHSDQPAQVQSPAPEPATDPDAANPDAANPDGLNPDAANPDAANPDAANPDAANPDAANPDAANPDNPNPPAVHPTQNPMEEPLTDAAVPPKNRRKAMANAKKGPTGTKRKATDDAEPPKARRTNKRAKKTPDENTPPTQSGSTSADTSTPPSTSSRGLRQRGKTGRVETAAKARPPPSKRIPVSERWAWDPLAPALSSQPPSA